MYCTKKYFFILCSLLMMCCTLSSCLKEDLSECPRPFNVRVRVLDADQKDITSSGEIKRAIVFVFDESGKKVERFDMSEGDIANRKPIRLKDFDFKSLTFVVCANLSDRMHDDLNAVNRIEDVKMRLFSKNGVSEAAPNLFQGSLTTQILYGDVVDDIDKTIDIHPKTSQVNIVIRGYEEWVERTETTIYNVTPFNFTVGSIKLGKTPDTYSGLGELTGDLVAYHPNGRINEDGDLLTPVFTIYPTLAQKPLDLSLWIKGEEKLRVNKASDGKMLIPEAGRMLNIFIDLKSAELHVSVVITPWNEVHQFVVY